MKITIKEIAQIAGVHRSTVDKVLHNRPGVSDEVRKKVQLIIDEFQYRPNQNGCALQKQNRLFRIGIILVDVDALPNLQAGIDLGLREFDSFRIETEFHTVRFSDAEAMAKHIDSMVDRSVDGIIVNPINAESVRRAAQRAAQKGIPLVTTNADLENVSRLCYVGQDGRRASRVAGRLMGEVVGGHGKIAVITSAIASESNNYYVKIRETEFIDYILEHYPAIQIVADIENMEERESTLMETMKLIQREPNLRGIYITCGGVAEVGQAVRISGKDGKLKVLGYESYPQIIDMIRSDCVTCTIDSDIEQQGRIPVQILMNYLLYGTVPQQDNCYTDIKIVLKELL